MRRNPCSELITWRRSTSDPLSGSARPKGCSLEPLRYVKQPVHELNLKKGDMGLCLKQPDRKR
jgi:hypothetical protein